MSTEESPEATARRMQQTQAKVDEVVDIMRVNVEKVLDRDKKISDLDNRAEVLAQGASQFEQQTGRLKRKYWWQNLKMMLIMGLVAAVILIIIIVWISTQVGGGSDAPDNTTISTTTATTINPTAMNSTTRT